MPCRKVLAATVPAGLHGTQIGTLVKLVRVLTLGPVVVGFSLFGRHLRANSGASGLGHAIRIYNLVPWFIVGFLILASLKSLGALPPERTAPLLKLGSVLTIVDGN